MPPQVIIKRLDTTTLFSKIQQLLACSIAFRRLFNPRNLEHDWYGYWNHVLLDVVKDTRNLIVCPQYVIWVAPDHADASDDSDESDESDEPEQETAQSSRPKLKSGLGSGQASLRLAQPTTGERISREMKKRRLSDADLEIMLADSDTMQRAKYPAKGKLPAPTPSVPIPSIRRKDADVPLKPVAKSADTVTGDASARITDFAILKIRENPAAESSSTSGGEGRLKATGIEIKVIIEIKRRPSRKLSGEELTSQILSKIQAASTDASVQAALLFHKFRVDSVVAIAASGNHWRHATLRRNNVDYLASELSLPVDLTYTGDHVNIKWSSILELDSAPSWQRLRSLASFCFSTYL